MEIRTDQQLAEMDLFKALQFLQGKKNDNEQQFFFIVHCQFSTVKVHCPLSTVNCQLSTVNCLTT